jgi:hypothetical protein
LSQTDAGGFFHYVRSEQTSLLVFEGPLDAMRVASISKQFAVVAMTGKRMSPSFLLFLRERKFKTIHVVPDNDVPSHELHFFLRYLASFCTQAAVRLLSVPQHAKDLCELTEEETLQWINLVGDPSLNHGPVLGLFGPARTAPDKVGG